MHLNLLAGYYLDNKKFYCTQNSKALREYIRCTVLSRIIHGDGHWKLARAYVDLACAYLDLKGYL